MNNISPISTHLHQIQIELKIKAKVVEIFTTGGSTLQISTQIYAPQSKDKAYRSCEGTR